MLKGSAILILIAVTLPASAALPTTAIAQMSNAPAMTTRWNLMPPRKRGVAVKSQQSASAATVMGPPAPGPLRLKLPRASSAAAVPACSIRFDTPEARDSICRIAAVL